MKSFKLFIGSVIAIVCLVVSGGVFTSCTNDDDQLLAGDSQTEQVLSLDQDSVKAVTRSISTYNTYTSVPAVHYYVRNSESGINLKAKGTRVYYGGVLTASLLKFNGSEMKVRIEKQDFSSFIHNGAAIIYAGGLSNVSLASTTYSAGVDHIDLTFDIESAGNFFSNGYGVLHIYPITYDLVYHDAYYAEPIVVYTSPKYPSQPYTYNQSLGKVNGVNLKASDYDLMEEYDLSVQCTEFCKRYYSTLNNHDVTNGNPSTNGGNAGGWFTDTTKNLETYSNGGTVRPHEGDILCMRKDPMDNDKGHVAIIVEVGSSYIRIAQQNGGIPATTLGWNAPIGGTLNYNYSTNTVSSPTGFYVQGWMRMHPY